MDEVLTQRSLLVPASIVLAGTLVGAGLFFGLYLGRAPPLPASSASSPTISPRVVIAPLATVTEDPSSAAALRTPPPGVSVALQARVDKEAAEGLAALHAELVSRCWAPSVAKDPKPERLTVRVRFLFDASGAAIRHGVADAEPPSRKDVTGCLRDAKLDVRVEPPGVVVGTELALALP